MEVGVVKIEVGVVITGGTGKVITGGTGKVVGVAWDFGGFNGLGFGGRPLLGLPAEPHYHR